MPGRCGHNCLQHGGEPALDSFRSVIGMFCTDTVLVSCMMTGFVHCADGKSLDIASILVRHGVDTDAWAEGPDGCQQTLLHR